MLPVSRSVNSAVMPLHLCVMLNVSMNRLWLILALTFVLTSVSCHPFDWSFDEVARATNPSGKVDAVLVEMHGGATTSFGYSIYIVPKGKSVSQWDSQVAKLYGAVRNENAYGVNLKWDVGVTLAAEYLRAKNSEVIKETVMVGGEQVTVTLRPNVSDPSAQAGGMLYNLEKSR
jgi:hypothetical protein